MARARNVQKLNSETKASASRGRLTAKMEKQTKQPPASAELEKVARTNSSDPARPSGKLGLLVDHLAVDAGATADELAAATGWQKHTVLGALSRLRSRGFAMRLETVGDRKAYRLIASEA